MAKKPKEEGLSQYAEDYGFQVAFLKSDAELYALFKKAVSGKWTPEKFTASIQKTKWYRTHTEAYRQNLALQNADPATYKAKLNSLIGDIADKASSLGVSFNNAQLNNLAKHYMDLGWNDSQLNNVMSKYITFTHAKGQARSNIQAMQQSAWKNGLRYSDSTYRTWAQRIARGDGTLDDFVQATRGQAKTLAPGFADQINAGMDLHDIASPYMQSMAQTLELNPSDIDLFDPTIRHALGAKDEDGKPSTMSIFDFEQSLRNDKRWMKTKNAQDSLMSTAHNILQTFGLAT